MHDLPRTLWTNSVQSNLHNVDSKRFTNLPSSLSCVAASSCGENDRSSVGGRLVGGLPGSCRLLPWPPHQGTAGACAGGANVVTNSRIAWASCGAKFLWVPFLLQFS
jgi:hypothetical protein